MSVHYFLKSLLKSRDVSLHLFEDLALDSAHLENGNDNAISRDFVGAMKMQMLSQPSAKSWVSQTVP